MSQFLVIVESPTKIKTLRKFLGDQYSFESSLGHIRDLPKKSFGIDLEKEFTPQYEVVEGKGAVVAKLRAAARQSKKIYLCPDPDREGEAIAWHIGTLLGEKVPIQRVTFNSITKDEVMRALAHPRKVDMGLVNAQQARRILDRLVGYTVSPVVAKRFQGAGRFQGSTSLSAGRVQSVALKLVVDREIEIEKFRPLEYWVIWTHLQEQEQKAPLKAMVWEIDGRRVEKEPANDKSTAIANQETAENVKRRLERARYRVSRVERREKKRHPVPPFTTSTLQQEASRHFGFSAARTMRVAQSLYEGVDLGSRGSVGLLTYIRTDSVRSAPEALHQARAFIQKNFGADYLPETPRQFSSKKSAQDAHECIRPTEVALTPDQVRAHLEPDQFKLYSLAWKRFTSCQMISAVYDTVSIDIDASPGILLRATGSILRFPGFLAVYEERVDEDADQEQGAQLPPLREGQTLKLDQVELQQSFTKPPPRFTEASLVKELEKSGIGRPSTYAAIMSKIQSKAYSVKEGNRLKPTELGCLLAKALEKHFPMIMDIGFTASMEDQLDQVSGQQKEWTALLAEFWVEFKPLLERADNEMAPPRQETDRKCPKCGKFLEKIWYRSKFFLGCTGYPDCDFRSSLEAMDFNKEDYAPEFDWEQTCPNCKSAMKVRHGRYGTFLGCEKYPDCRGIIQIPKRGEASAQETREACPAIDCPGQLVSRRSRFGKTFYSCSTFPECDVIGPNQAAICEKYQNHPRTAPPAKTSGRGAKKAPPTRKATKLRPAVKKKSAKAEPKSSNGSKAAPTLTPSAQLKEVLGTEATSRPAALSGVWKYIRDQNLQDPKDRRYVVPDERLGRLFPDQPRVHMMKIAGGLTPHLKTGRN